MKNLLLAIGVALFLCFFTYYRTDGFSLSKINGTLVSGTALPLESKYHDALLQPYHYLAKGRQCFVFVSEDQKTVIKFLNYDRFSLPFVFKFLPTSTKELEEKRKSRFDAVIRSYELAMQKLRNETGLIYLHFQKGEGLPILEIIDGGHRIHRIDLNNTAFVIQKKAKMIFDELESRWQNDGQAGLNEDLKCFVNFIDYRCCNEIADDDRDVEINFGFYEHQLMLLDPGRLYLDQSLHGCERKEREMRIASKRLRKWLQTHHSESVSYLDELILQTFRTNCKTLTLVF